MSTKQPEPAQPNIGDGDQSAMAKRCEGWRRTGGAFSFGPPTWVQCPNKASVILEVQQDGVIEKMPSCTTCWKEAIDKHIKILSVEPIMEG